MRRNGPFRFAASRRFIVAGNGGRSMCVLVFHVRGVAMGRARKTSYLLLLRFRSLPIPIL